MRNAHVDRLRGLSIAMVVLFHSGGLLPWQIDPVPVWAVLLIVRNGYLGVSMFFVISGFLITSKVLRPGSNKVPFSTWSFYSQRIGRILPCLALMFVLAEALCLLGVPQFTFDQTKHPAWEIALYIFTFRYNVYMLHHPGLPPLWNVLWSLSIEEVFYLSFPVLFGALKKKAIIVPILLIVVIVGPIRRAILGPVGLWYYFGCFDQIALGSLAAIISCTALFRKLHQHLFSILRWPALAFIIFVCLRSPIEKDFVFEPSFVALGAAIYLVGCAYNPWQAPLASSRLSFLELCGRLSYEMYLFHMFLLVGLTKTVVSMVTPANAALVSYVSNAIFWVLLISLAWTISRSFSEPSNRAIRRFLPKIPRSLGVERPLTLKA
jgi:peptidoglycan/LPS O-acetylase OafA/YrhL